MDGIGGGYDSKVVVLEVMCNEVLVLGCCEVWNIEEVFVEGVNVIVFKGYSGYV